MMDFEQKQILGAYFRNYRKSRKLTIRQISASLRGISETCISEFETGRSNTLDDAIIYLFGSYSVDFSFEQEYIYKRKETIKNLMDEYGKLNFEKFEALVSEISSNLRYKNSFCYPLYLICLFYKEALLEPKSQIEVKKIICEIENVKKLLSTEENQLYSIFLYRYTYPSDEEEALKILHEEYQKNQDSQSVLTAIIEFLLSGSEYIRRNYFAQIRLPRAALETFEKKNYFQRAVNCLSDLGLAYVEVLDYHSAIEMTNKFLHISEQINNQRGIMSALNNLAFIYFKKKDYSMVKYYAEQVLLDERNSLSAYSMLVSAERNLGNYPEAKKRLKEFEELVQTKQDDYYRFQLKIEKARVYEKMGAHYYSMLKNSLEYSLENMPISNWINTYELLIEYCRKNGLKDNLIEYQDGLIQCYGRIRNLQK